MRLFQQGHWVEENHIEWVNTCDISTPEQAKKIGLAAFQLYLNRYYKNGEKLPNKEYTLEQHKKIWTWRGGEVRNDDDKSNKQAWEHFESQKTAAESKSQKFYDAYEAFLLEDYEKVLKYLDGWDDIHLTFQIIETKDEFVMEPKGYNDDEDE